MSIHTGPELGGKLLCYLSTVRVPRPFKMFHWAGCTFYRRSRGNVFGKQSKRGIAEFLGEFLLVRFVWAMCVRVGGVRCLEY